MEEQVAHALRAVAYAWNCMQLGMIPCIDLAKLLVLNSMQPAHSLTNPGSCFPPDILALSEMFSRLNLVT